MVDHDDDVVDTTVVALVLCQPMRTDYIRISTV